MVVRMGKGVGVDVQAGCVHVETCCPSGRWEQLQRAHLNTILMRLSLWLPTYPSTHTLRINSIMTGYSSVDRWSGNHTHTDAHRHRHRHTLSLLTRKRLYLKF